VRELCEMFSLNPREIRPLTLNAVKSTTREE
jgi:hypothetical protein